MTKRTRLFLLGAGAILVVGLGTGLLAYYVGGQNFGILRADGPGELDYVPEEARVVAFANVRDVMDSQLRQRIREAQPGSAEGLEKFRAETGIDLERDIEYVLLFSGDQAPAAAMPPVVLARGVFDQGRVQAFLEDQGAAAEEYSGYRLLLHPNGRVAVALLEPGLVAVGGADGVRRAIDARLAGRSVRDNAELMQHVRDASDGTAWTVARFEALADGRLPGEIVGRLPAITWLSATGEVNGGLRAVLRADTRDEASAENLRDVVQGFLALARMQAGQRPELDVLMDSIQLGGQGRSVSLSFAVPAEVIDTLASLGPGRRPPPAP